MQPGEKRMWGQARGDSAFWTVHVNEEQNRRVSRCKRTFCKLSSKGEQVAVSKEEQVRAAAKDTDVSKG